MSGEPKVDVRALSQLARLEVSDAEVVQLEKELPNILAFVETIQAASVKDSGVPKADTSLRNVMRADEDPHESGKYTEALLSAAPRREGDKVVVKQVISRKKN